MVKPGLCAALIAFSAIVVTVPVALAQSAEDCEAGLTEVNGSINALMESQTPGSEEAATNAREMTNAAASARDEGNHARCMELVNDAKAVIEGVN